MVTEKIVDTFVVTCPGCSQQVIVAKYACGCQRVTVDLNTTAPTSKCTDFKQYNLYCSRHRHDD